jgi:hypothetical protein
MPEWIPSAIILAYAGIVILLTLAAVFSETTDRRDAAYKVLILLLPWGLLAAVLPVLMQHFGIGTPPQ